MSMRFKEILGEKPKIKRFLGVSGDFRRNLKILGVLGDFRRRGNPVYRELMQIQ